MRVAIAIRCLMFMLILQAFAWGQERAAPEPTYGRSL
jgi:hypothetical protein